MQITETCGSVHKTLLDAIADIVPLMLYNAIRPTHVREVRIFLADGGGFELNITFES